MKPILKVSLSFVNLSSGNLLVFVNGVLAGFLTNVNYATPTPNYAAMEVLRDNFSIAVVNAQYGGTHLNNIKRDKRNLLIDALRMWANYVNINNYDYDRTIMETSGFKIIGGSRNRRSVPEDITTLILEQGRLSGTLKVTVNVVEFADYYLVRYKDPGDPDNPDWRYLPASSSSRMLITGLRKTATIEVQALAGNTTYGQSNWTAITLFEYVK